MHTVYITYCVCVFLYVSLYVCCVLSGIIKFRMYLVYRSCLFALSVSLYVPGTPVTGIHNDLAYLHTIPGNDNNLFSNIV